MGCCLGRSKSKFQSDKATSHIARDLQGGSLTKVRKFTYHELRVATDNFNQDNKLGRGGFGIVYKGTLKDGANVAIKTLSAESKQGVREFLTEIDTISNVKHSNLVELVGCCVEGSNRILVYEYVENNSLDQALLGYTSDRSKLGWELRRDICLGTANGLAFLHEELVPQIVHRDIKASNILLDKEFLPKIGDFGLAKLFPDNITHISTQIAGTTILELVDVELRDYPQEQVIRYIIVAFFCTQPSPKRRPLISQVIEMLTKDKRLDEKQLSAPGFVAVSGSGLASQQFSSVPVTITELTPR
ncbi:hypothetical protein V2J09_019587 [Rumex salicifolius]